MGAAAHFGLSRDPFAPTVDPAEAFESQAFVGAREALQRELADGGRLIALVGAAGTGKTLLLQATERALARAGRRVVRIDRGDLLDQAALPDADIVLIDEADRLGEAGLAELARKVADPARPAAIVALARRSFDHLDLAVAPRVVMLEELGSNDARDFIIDRVERASGRASLFSPGALGALTYAASGSPRLLRLLASGAMFQAAQDGASQVAMGHARRAIAMQRGAIDLPPDEPEEILLGPAAVLEPEPVPVAVGVSPRASRLTAEPATPPPNVMPPPAKAPPIAPIPPQTDLPPPPPASAPVAEPAPTNWRPVVAAGFGALLVLIGAALVWRPSEPSREPASVAAPQAAARPAGATTEPPPAPAPAATIEPPSTAAPEPIAAAAPPEPEPEVVSRPVPAKPLVAEAQVEAPPAAPEPVVPEPPAPPRVVVRYAGGQPGAAEAAGRIADLLEARGYEIADVRAAPGRIRQGSTRYAAGERSAGEAVNGAFETVLRAYQPGAVSRAAPNAEGDAARGTIEVWVPDSAAGASRPLRTDRPPG